MKHLRVYRHIALRRDHPRRHVADGPRWSRGTWTNEAKHVNSPKAANRARHVFAPRNWCVRNLLAQSAPPALSLIGRLPACICHRSWAVVAPLAKRAARHQLRAAAPRSHAVRSQQGFLQPCASPLVLMHPVANPFLCSLRPSCRRALSRRAVRGACPCARSAVPLLRTAAAAATANYQLVHTAERRQSSWAWRPRTVARGAARTSACAYVRVRVS